MYARVISRFPPLSSPPPPDPFLLCTGDERCKQACGMCVYFPATPLFLFLSYCFLLVPSFHLGFIIIITTATKSIAAGAAAATAAAAAAVGRRWFLLAYSSLDACL